MFNTLKKFSIIPFVNVTKITSNIYILDIFKIIIIITHDTNIGAINAKKKKNNNKKLLYTSKIIEFVVTKQQQI